MFDILAQLGELAPDMIRRKPNGPPKQMLLPSQMAIGEMMQGAQEGMSPSNLVNGQKEAWVYDGGSAHGHDGAAEDNHWGDSRPHDAMMARPDGMKGALMGAVSQLGSMGGGEDIQHAPFEMQNNPIRQQTISSLRGYYGGGMLRPGQSGLVGDEVVQVDENGAKIIPVDGSENRDAEADTQGYFRVNPSHGELPQPIDAPTGGTTLPQPINAPTGGVALSGMTQPDARQLINPQDQAIADEYGKLDVERQKTTKSPWKDAGFGILQGLNNVLNRRNDPIQGWNEFGEEKRMRPIKQRIGELEGQKKLQQESEYNKARTDTIYTDDTRQRLELERRKIDDDRKKIKDERAYEMQNKTLDWKKEDRDRYFELEDLKQKARDKRDDRAYEIADRRQKELERNNKAVVESREKIAGMSQAGQDRRAALGREAQKLLAEYNQAQTSGRANDANALRERLAKLKAEADALK